jgi:hypothetical protein
LFGLALPVASQDFYDVSTVHTIQITFTQSNWDRILDSLFAASEDRLIGTVVIDGVQYDSVGIRYKGNSTYSANRVKNPLNIKLDHIIDNQTIQGYGTLKLANVWFDPSFVREVLSYEIANNYMPSSKANYCNVYINGTLLGLYVSVQDVDKLFMRTHFMDDAGVRFKGEVAFGGPQTIYTVWGYDSEDSSDYTDRYEIESNEGWSELIDFLDTLNNNTAEVEKVLDVDRHLWMLAYDNLFVNLDAPINFAHNYYLYRDASHRFNPIIWDLNMNFGGFSQIIGGSGLSIAQMQQLNPYLNENNSNYPIVNKFLQNATYKKRYVAHMKTIISEMIATDWYRTRALELQAIVDAHVQADPNKYSTYSSFLNNINSSVGQTPGLVQLMSARMTYLNSRPLFAATAPTITDMGHTATPVMTGSTIWVVATVANATPVSLKYRDQPVAPFTALTMFDDGAHNDGVSGDGIFGASITAGTGDIHFYIYAENASAATFLPPRAEFEDYTLTVTTPTVSAVKINEFMADNASAQADQNGEFEDWVELYNPTSAPISLTGCHLSDNVTNRGKWTFPDTSIAPFSFVTIWTDQDTTQAGLHANFALSKSGEAVILTDPSLILIDSVLFGAQVTDSSMARCPDGSGSFARMAPTFAASNCSVSCCTGTRGNVNNAETIDLSDLSQLIAYLTVAPRLTLPCEDAANVNGSDAIDLSDLSLLITYMTVTPKPTLPACP